MAGSPNPLAIMLVYRVPSRTFLIRRENHFVRNFTYPFDLNLDKIPRLEVDLRFCASSHTTDSVNRCSRISISLGINHLLWRAGHNHGSLFDCDTLAQVPQDGGDPKYHVVSIAVLLDLTVDPGLEMQVLRVADCGRRYEDRPNRSKGIKRLGVSILSSRLF